MRMKPLSPASAPEGAFLHPNGIPFPCQRSAEAVPIRNGAVGGFADAGHAARFRLCQIAARCYLAGLLIFLDDGFGNF